MRVPGLLVGNKLGASGRGIKKEGGAQAVRPPLLFTLEV
jgi:hypothetical protein